MDFKFTRQQIELKTLRINDDSATEEDTCHFHNRQFRIKHPGVLTSEAIHLLLELNPIYIVPIPGKRVYKVIYGLRLFELASHVLKPSDKIAVNMVSNKFSEENIALLNYLDTVVVPSVESLDIGYAELYEIIISDQRFISEIWSITTKAEFARAFETSRSQLSQKYEGQKIVVLK